MTCQEFSGLKETNLEREVPNVQPICYEQCPESQDSSGAASCNEKVQSSPSCFLQVGVSLNEEGIV